MTRILLINPSLEFKIDVTTSWDIRSDKQGIYPPLGLLYIGTFLQKKLDVNIKLIDMVADNLTYKNLEELILKFNPNVVGITSCTENFLSSLEVAKVTKKVDKKILTVIGGPHCIMFPNETLHHKEIDFLIAGEGEIVFYEFIKNLDSLENIEKLKGFWFKKNNIIIDNGISNNIKNLDELPFPDRKLLDLSKYYCILGRKKNVITISSSRGCPHQCIYCDLKIKEFRLRTPENVFNEIKKCVELGFEEFYFIDDMFNITPKRVIEISEKILKLPKKIKWSFRGRVDTITNESLKIAAKSGCERIQFGLESSTDKKLKFLKKNITTKQIETAIKITNKNKIMSVGNFILGLPIEQNINDINITINFAKKLNLDYAEFHLLKIWPGTELFDLAVKKNLANLDEWKNFVKNADLHFKPKMWTEHFNKDELRNIIKKAFREFYFRPSYIIKNFFKTNSLYELKRKILGFFELIKK